MSHFANVLDISFRPVTLIADSRYQLRPLAQLHHFCSIQFPVDYNLTDLTWPREPPASLRPTYVIQLNGSIARIAQADIVQNYQAFLLLRIYVTNRPSEVHLVHSGCQRSRGRLHLIRPQHEFNEDGTKKAIQQHHISRASRISGATR